MLLWSTALKKQLIAELAKQKTRKKREIGRMDRASYIPFLLGYPCTCNPAKRPFGNWRIFIKQNAIHPPIQLKKKKKQLYFGVVNFSYFYWHNH